MRTRNTTRTRVAITLAASTLLVAGCASSEGGTEDEQDGGSSGSQSMTKEEIYVKGIVNVDGDEGEPVKGGTLTVVDYSEARSLDPTTTIPNGAAGGNALAAVYDILFEYDFDSGEYNPRLGESLEPNDDYTEWTLTLRDGVTFSDGTPLDAAAVVGSIGYYMQNQGFNTLQLATNIKDMKPTGDNTVVFTLNQPWSTFPAMLASGPGMILAPAAIKGGKEGFEPIGAGPFVFENYAPSEELVLKPNPDYWDEEPNLETLRFVWLGADEAKLESLRAGSVDVVSVRAPEALEDARKEGWAGFMYPSGLSNMFWINNREDRPGSDPRIRRAINMAIDLDAYYQRTSNGAGVPSRNIYSPAFDYFREVDTVEYDPEQAKELVAEAKADGADTTLVYLGQSDPISQTAAVTVEAQLEAVGFDVEIEGLRDITEQITRLYSTFDYDMAVGAMSIAEDPFTSLANNLNSQSPMNPAGYASEEMDKLIFQLQGAELEDQPAILEEINQLWQEDLPSVAVGAGGFFSPWQENVHGITGTSNDIMFFDDAWKSE